MKREIGVISTAVVFSLVLMTNLPMIKASGTIYIRADGSVDSSTAAIHQIYAIGR